MRKGFTLVELVMVIVILGILAGVAIPTFFNLQDEAKISSVKGAIGGIRSAIAIWYAKEAVSGLATWPTLGELSDTTGGVFAGGAIPNNPYTNSAEFKAGSSESADSTVGWIYDQATGRVWSSASETQGSGF
jgi:prepilin-type N-terminal cleavage/methylation domain-containing protein